MGLEELEKSGEDHCQFVGAGCFGHDEVVGEELKDMFPFHYWIVAGIVMVKKDSRTNVESTGVMILPNNVFCQSVMNNDMASRWCQGCCVGVKDYMDLYVCRNIKIDTGWAHKVDNQEG